MFLLEFYTHKRWTRNLNLVEPLVVVTRTLSVYFKVIRLHTKLHDAAGAVRAHSGKGPGFCFMIGRGPNSCLLCHGTGLLLCRYIKIFLPSSFDTVDFRSSMSGFVVDIGFADENVIKKMGIFLMGLFRDSHSSSKKVQTDKAVSLVHRKLAENRVEQWTFVELQGTYQHSS